MFDFIFSEQNFLYNVSIGIVIGLGLLEGLGLILGMSLVAAFDHVSPFDLDFELDANTADVTTGGLTQLLGWLCLNRLPLLVWIVLFLTCFAIIGYVINFTSVSLFGYMLPNIIAIPSVLFLGLCLTGRVGHRLANIMPQNESSAVSSTSFTGKLALITSGTAKFGSPTEAKIIDDFKQTHYVMVEPLEQSETFIRGDEVILVQKNKTCWQAVSTK